MNIHTHMHSHITVYKYMYTYEDTYTQTHKYMYKHRYSCKKESWQNFCLHICKCEFYQKDQKLYMLQALPVHVLSRVQTTIFNKPS